MNSARNHRANVESDETLLQPDTFWELIEKILLNTIRDEQSRQRHNAALSALCRGHALPRFPRESKHKATTKSAYRGRPREGFAVPNSVKGKKRGTKVSVPKCAKEKKHIIRVSATQTGSKADLPQKDTKRSKSVDDCDKPKAATEVKSECQLNDHDIVYLEEEAPVSASEKLWRYAIKNRKRSEEDKGRKYAYDKKKPTPSIRSNEAIFLGLRKRMEDAAHEKILKEEKEKAKKEKTHRRHSCQHIQQIRSDMNIDNVNNVDNVVPVWRSPSDQLTQSAQIQLHKTFIKPARSVLTLQHGLHKSEMGMKTIRSKEHMFSPWGQETGCSDLTNLAAVKSNNSFDSKKALYNDIIKRRLNCGNQLDSLNKEIITKKSSPNTIQIKETTRKYAELKSEYLNLCYQESMLRYQIALLHAEIYMMQNRGYHKRPATVKTITLDSVTTPVNHKHDHMTDDGVLPMFPSLKAPRPLITSLQKCGQEKLLDKLNSRNRLREQNTEDSTSEGSNDFRSSVLKGIHGYSDSPIGVCSIYSLTPQIVTQPR